MSRLGGCVRTVAVLAVALPFLVLSAGAASASCATPAARSPNAFVGTVVYVKDGGRVASVRLPGGEVVTVDGRGEAGAAASVDRSFEVGQAYEFHPANDSDPYLDNACTATHPVAAEVAEQDPEDPDVIPWWPPFNYRGPLAWVIFTSLGFLPVVGAVVVLLVIRRRAGETDEVEDEDAGDPAGNDHESGAHDDPDDIWRFDRPPRPVRERPPGALIADTDIDDADRPVTPDEGGEAQADGPVVP